METVRGTRRLVYNEFDIKFRLGDSLVNVLSINYEPPVPGWHYLYHNHSSYELHVIPSGKGMLAAQHKAYDIVPGTVYLTGPGVYHKQEADRLEPMSEYCINFELKSLLQPSGKHVFDLEDELADIIGAWKNQSFWFGYDVNGIAPLMEEILQELSRQHVGCYTLVQHLIGQIIIKLARCFMGKLESNVPLPRKIPSDRRRMVVDNYFIRNSNGTPDMLARKIGVSVRQLNRILLEYYAMTFKQKVNSVRMERARDLLRHTDLRVKEIAMQTGYESDSYFCKLFKEMNGLTPLEYREAD